LIIGDAANLTGGRVLAKGKPRPTFYAGAQQLVNDGLAAWIYEGQGQGSKSRLATNKIWGVKLTDLAKADTYINTYTAQLALAPYLITIEKFMESCAPMSDRERATYAHTDLKKFMLMPPPPAPAARTPAGTGAAGASRASGNPSGEEGLDEGVTSPPAGEGGSGLRRSARSPRSPRGPSQSAAASSPVDGAQSPHKKKPKPSSFSGGMGAGSSEAPAALVPAPAAGKTTGGSLLGQLANGFRSGFL
jgi:hypothetical protein